MKTHEMITEALDSIHADEGLINETLIRLHQKRDRLATKRRNPALRRVLATACAVLLAVGLYGGMRLYSTPIAFISVDVNPSIEISINRLNRVVGASAFNEDGEAVLDQMRLDGRGYQEALEFLLNSEAMAAYLETENASLTLTVAAMDEAKRGELLAWLQNSPISAEHHGTYEYADAHLLDEAHANGYSFGKYAVYKQLAAYDPTVTADSCHAMTMSELQAEVGRHEAHEGQHHAGQHHEEACHENEKAE